MARKTKSKKKLEVKPKETNDAKQQAIPDQPSYAGNDYGGLPDRDIKKNLGGCG